MSLIRRIDHGIRKMLFSIFWWFIDPLEQERLYGELIDKLDRNLDAHDPEQLMAPDNYDVLVNNTVFIKHAHAIKKLETVMIDRLQKYVAEKDYELPRPKIKLQINSSATISKHKADIRCWFSTPEEEDESPKEAAKIRLTVIDGEGKGLKWYLTPGTKYQIGRVSSAEICLPFEKISKNQASLHFVSKDKITLVDEGSTNGTYINDEDAPIKGRREISIGDKIRFCKLDPIIMTFTAE
ncbi:MAG: FHA domain-containing protein [bacterium]